MTKLVYMSTIHNKGIYATTIVQCALSCKWLPPVSGRVIFFPINAPGMGRFKLFDLVGYS